MSSTTDTTNEATSYAENVPSIKADSMLRAFRLEGEFSWRDMNRLSTQICQYITAPAFDVLLHVTMTGKPEYERCLSILTADILATGIFGPMQPAIWKYGRHPNKPDIVRIADYVRRLTHYVAQRIVDQISEPTELRNITANKVGAWLTNQSATEWNDYAFVNREAAVRAPRFLHHPAPMENAFRP
ncbi:hypothetical protein Q9L58_007823 [Maublancomyces gigas]|uniref:Uncharacterized protein n=1 Tax=Discina gigas TaxID=1032678 RepID=A0ABR3GBF8_9PEZI